MFGHWKRRALEAEERLAWARCECAGHYSHKLYLIDKRDRLHAKAAGRAATIRRLVEGAQLLGRLYLDALRMCSRLRAKIKAQAAIARIDQAHLRYERSILEESWHNALSGWRKARERADKAEAERDAEIAEFNAGWEAAQRGEPIDADPEPPQDNWRNGWCAFHGDRQVAERDAALDALQTIADRIGDALLLVQARKEER